MLLSRSIRPCESKHGNARTFAEQVIASIIIDCRCRMSGVACRTAPPIGGPSCFYFFACYESIVQKNVVDCRTYIQFIIMIILTVCCSSLKLVTRISFSKQRNTINFSYNFMDNFRITPKSSTHPDWCLNMQNTINVIVLNWLSNWVKWYSYRNMKDFLNDVEVNSYCAAILELTTWRTKTSNYFELKMWHDS